MEAALAMILILTFINAVMNLATLYTLNGEKHE